MHSDPKNLECLLGRPTGVRVLPNRTRRIVNVPPAETALLLQSSLPKPTYLIAQGPVMTDEQVETLRRQISVYATICNQLVEMHKATTTQQSAMPNPIIGQCLPLETALGTSGFRSTGRQRWTPSQTQLQILEKLFEKGNGTPNKKQVKEITAQLIQHGPISETNVYNWFQNRKARAKRKQQVSTERDGEEVETDEVESPNDNQTKFEKGNQECQGPEQVMVNQSIGMMEQKQLASYQHHAAQENVISTVECSQIDTQHSTPLNSGVIFEHGHHVSKSLVAIIDGKPWEVPSGSLDVNGSFGETAALLDSQMRVVATNESGFTHQPLCAGENYTLAGDGDTVRRIATQASDGLFHLDQNLGLLDQQGLMSRPELHQQRQFYSSSFGTSTACTDEVLECAHSRCLFPPADHVHPSN